MAMEDNVRGMDGRENGCGCGEKGLEYFHELINASAHEFDEADQFSDQAIEQLSRAVESQKKATEKRREAEAILYKAYEWLSKYGYRYDCNVRNVSCVQLARQLRAIAMKLAQYENEGTKKAQEALKLLQQAELIERRLGKETERYIGCIHTKRCDNGHSYQDDQF